MKNPLKHSVSVKIKKHDKYHEFILQDAVENVGAMNWKTEERLTVSRNHDEYAVYSFDYIYPYGVDYDTDEKNMKRTNEIIKHLEGTFKLIPFSSAKKNLDRSIEHQEKMMKTLLEDDSLRDVYQESIDVMKFYNEEQYFTYYIFIEKRDIDAFVKTSQNVLNIYRLSQREVIELFDTLNNEME